MIGDDEFGGDEIVVAGICGGLLFGALPEGALLEGEGHNV
jgi:hypothetical protein